MTEKERKRRQKRRNQISEFIKQNRDQIISNGALSLGLDPENLTSEDRRWIIASFKEDYNQRAISSGKLFYNMTDKESRAVLQRTLGGAAFTSDQERDFINLRKALMSTGQWSVFRDVLNRKQSLEAYNLSTGKIDSGDPGVRKKWVYNASGNRKIIIKLHYEQDGTSWFEMYKTDAAGKLIKY